jgi:hypothetical protein
MLSQNPAVAAESRGRAANLMDGARSATAATALLSGIEPTRDALIAQDAKGRRWLSFDAVCAPEGSRGRS